LQTSDPVDPFQQAELVFALVAPVGLDYEQIAEHIKSQLSEFRYTAETIKLSGKIAPLCKVFNVPLKTSFANEADRIRSYMHAGNLLCAAYNAECSKGEENALLAVAAASEIAAIRRRSAEPAEPGKTITKPALLNRAHILVTIKRPEEVDYLRKIYGIGLHVVGIFGTEEERIRYLTRQRHLEAADAELLIGDDRDDKKVGGQRTEDAYQLADFFVDVGAGSDSWKSEISRYLDLIFSHPYKTPTREEQGMFFAYAASLRSAQFGRQVGAAVTNQRGDLISQGCNEVPKAGGGQYWYPDQPDERDHELGCDSNDQEKTRIMDEILRAISTEAMSDQELRGRIKRTSLFEITEYGRATHAEMEALLSCARRGVSTTGAFLYTTTFPCHNCARHIIDAGIDRVVYIEPYPKSRAGTLHRDAIVHESEARSGSETLNRVRFVPFVGISPRKYAEIFTVKPMYGKTVDRKLKGSGEAINWQRNRTGLRLAMLPLSYIERESLAAARLAERIEKQTTDKPTEQGGKDVGSR
jgi:deoxycytidylate deaminase